MGGDEAAGAEDVQAVGEVVNLGQVGRDQENAGARVQELGEDAVDLGLGADVDADGGLVEDEQVGAVAEPFADDDLLLVAARQGGGGDTGGAGDDAHALDLFGRGFRFGGTRHQARLAEAVEDGEVEVEADAERHAQALITPTFGDEGHAAVDGVALAGRVKRLVFEGDLAGGALRSSEEALGELAAAGADQTVEAHDLARADFKRHIGEAGAGQVSDGEQRGADRDRFLVVGVGQRTGDHVADQRRLVGIGDVAGGDQGAVAQNRDAVGELEDLLHAVADIDDRDALAVEAADEGEEGVGFLAGQVAGGLVEDEKAGAAHGGARGGDELLLADGEGGERSGGVDVKAEIVEDLLGLAAHVAFAEQDAAGQTLVAQEHVGCDVEVPAEDDLLVDGVDAAGDGVLRRGERDLLAAPKDRTGAAHDGAGEDLDHRRFAGAVLAHQRVDLAFAEGEIAGLERVGGAVAFVDATELHDRNGGHGRQPMSGFSSACDLALLRLDMSITVTPVSTFLGTGLLWAASSAILTPS